MREKENCTHRHTRLIAKDKDAEYIECKDCGAILETREFEARPSNEPNNHDGDESLSDA